MTTSSSGKARNCRSAKPATSSVLQSFTAEQWLRLQIAVLAAFLALAPTSRDGNSDPDLLVGPTTHVRDGDTLELKGPAVRRCGMTCDETGALANAATRRIRSMTGAEATCRVNGECSGDRLVGWCAVGGPELGALLISEGLCGRCPRYDPEDAYTALAARVSWPSDVPDDCRARR